MEEDLHEETHKSPLYNDHVDRIDKEFSSALSYESLPFFQVHFRFIPLPFVSQIYLKLLSHSSSFVLDLISQASLSQAQDDIEVLHLFQSVHNHSILILFITESSNTLTLLSLIFCFFCIHYFCILSWSFSWSYSFTITISVTRRTY